MSIVRLLPGPHISEFAKSSSGVVKNGRCTQASAAMGFAASYHPDWSQQQCIDFMEAMREAMFARGECADNGAATVANMAKELRQRGANILTEWDFAGNAMPEDWHTLIKDQAGITPILLQVSNAQGLFDVSGAKEDQGVHYHAIYVAGIAQEGYVIYDPNNPTVMHSGDIYNLAALQAASPCGLIQLAAPVSATKGTPKDWGDDGATLTSPNGVTITGALRDYVLAYPGGWPSWNQPAAPMRQSGDEWILTFQCGPELGWTQAGGVVWGGIGQEVLDLRKRVFDLEQELAQGNNDKTTIQGVLADLANLQTTLAPLAK